MKLKLALGVFLISLGLIPLAAGAGTVGLSLGSFGELLVENLAIGENYSMMKLMNMPFEVKYKGEASVNLSLKATKPLPTEVKPGFEAIPDTNWISFGNSLVAMAPNSTFKTDVNISIPNDKQYLGKKYHVALLASLSSGIPGDTRVQMGVIGKLLFTIAPMEKPVRSSSDQAVNLNFTFEPALLKLEDVQLGQKTNILTADKKPVIIKNLSDKEIKCLMTSLDPKKEVSSIYPYYEACPNPEFLQFKEKNIIVAPGKEKPLNMWLEIPDQPEYRGKSYQFVISFSNDAATTGKKNMRILVKTVK
jgi:hypothetical protein